MKIHVFTDCVDKKNAKKRQIERYESLFPGAKVKCKKLNSKNYVPVLTGAIDVMDAVRFGAVPYIFIFNIASRTETQYKNGAPFCFAKLGRSLIIGTPWSFCMLKKLGVLNEVHITDVFEVCKNFVTKAEARRIAESQFRSFDYVPFLAKWLSENKNVPSKILKLSKVEIKEQVWHIDCFKNAKTTIPNSFLKGRKNGTFVKTEYGQLPFYRRLADVPVGTLAITQGSSGYSKFRFAEIVINGGKAAKRLGLKVGSEV